MLITWREKDFFRRKKFLCVELNRLILKSILKII